MHLMWISAFPELPIHHGRVEDYSAFDPDNSSAGNGPMAARVGTSLVDESRWAGGLEPTSLGRVYNPTGSTGYNSPELQGYRQKLGRMKRIDE